VDRNALHALTAQERQIVALAASGLTNREIAERLKLSPRTIASHLYHVYPKLGVTRRHELREFTS
jgi:DNA-binding CsgD family transcriptional regulator